MKEREVPENSGEIVPLVIEDFVPQAGKLLWLASMGDSERASEIIRNSRKIEDSYLAYETVRLGERAGFIVGNVFVNGMKVPYTGLEPYAVGSGLKPKEIVMLEAEAGIKIKRILERGESRYLYKQNLKGEKANPEVISELSAIYGATLARFRALGDSYSSSFRLETYSKIKSLPDIFYKNEGPALYQKIIVPRIDNNVFKRMDMELGNEALQGINILTDFSRLGHPVIREAIRELN